MATLPKANRDFWLEKFARNRARDAAAIRLLRRQGWRVVVVWECEVADAELRLLRVLEARRVEVAKPVDH
jgi:DNA mismatch endonuclease (patch repair protein)